MYRLAQRDFGCVEAAGFLEHHFLSDHDHGFLVQGAAAADKVNHVLVYGSRLKNRHAFIYHISLSSTLILDTT